MQHTFMQFPGFVRVILGVFIVGLVFSGACVRHQPPPPPRVAPQAISSPPSYVDDRWELTALSYAYLGEGFDYSRAGLAPVVLKIYNTSGAPVHVMRDEVIGIAHDGSEYLVYTIEQATQLVYNSEYYRTSQDTAAGVAGGALLGAGLGSLVGLAAGGGNAIWQGALIGGAGGAVAGGIAGSSGSQRNLEQNVRRELTHFAWQQSPIPHLGSRAGYFYFPQVGITAVRVTVRSKLGDIETYELPLSR